VFSIYLGI